MAVVFIVQGSATGIVHSGLRVDCNDRERSWGCSCCTSGPCCQKSARPARKRLTVPREGASPIRPMNAARSMPNFPTLMARASEICVLRGLDKGVAKIDILGIDCGIRVLGPYLRSLQRQE